jgi:hypothetical protein
MYIGTLPLVSNKATFSQSFQAIDSETGTGFDLTGKTIDYALSGPNGESPLLTATNDDGIDIDDADEGFFTVNFTSAQMKTLCAKEYDVGCTITEGDEVIQIFVLKQPVIDGIVT